MSKMSCEAAESVEDALLRMARVNCNLVEHRGDFMLAWKSAYKKVRRERHFMSKNELRSSGERRRRAFANGAGEL